MRVISLLTVACALAVRAAPGHSTSASTTAQEPTEGRLVTRDGKQLVDVPLKHTQVRIRVDGYLADATVTQTFHNPYAKKIEAVYLFPLPTNAAVNEMEIESAGHRIRGAIHERNRAKRIYQRAREQGLVAALLTQERPNLFTQSVANIEPGAEVRVSIRYVQPLEYEAGGYEIVFPMVAPPRYMPGRSTDQDDPEQVQPAVLPPALRSSHDIDLAVQVDAGVAIKELRSPSHRIEIRRPASAPNLASVRLGAGDTIPNKDFVLRYEVAGAAPEFAVIAHRNGGPGSFFLLAQPPADATPAQVAPREVVFVLDTSSSMQGAPLAKAKEVIRAVLGGLRPDDTFQIVRFDDAASALGPRPIANKPDNLRYTLEWLDALAAGGGTEMVRGIAAALDVPHDPARLRIVAFLTDGYVGNEAEILKIVGARIGASRLFSFGVGSAVNRYLLEEMAVLGRGQAQVVRPDEDTKDAVARFYRRIDRAVLTDVRVDWNGLAVADIVPAAIPDLFVGQPLVLSGHYSRPGRALVTVSGRQAGREVSFEVPVVLPERDDQRPAVATVWARSRIAELSRALIRERNPAIEREIIKLALAHRLMTRYTAFVAVDESRVTAGGSADKVVVPVEIPEAVRGIGVAGGGVGFGSIGYGSFGTIGHGYGSGTGYGYGSGAGGMSGSAASAPQVRIGSATVVGNLDKTIIRRTIRRRLNAVKYCYQKQLVIDPSLEGTVTAEFSIDESGKVVEVSASGTGNEELEQCIAKVVGSIEFSAVNGGGLVVVHYPFLLRLSPEARVEEAKRNRPADLDLARELGVEE